MKQFEDVNYIAFKKKNDSEDGKLLDSFHTELCNSRIYNYIRDNGYNIKFTEDYVLRFLKMYGNDVDLAIKHISKMVDLMKRIKIKDLKVVMNDEVKEILGSEFFVRENNDKKGRSIVKINVWRLNKNKSKLSYLHAAISFFNKIENEMIIVVDMNNLSHNDFTCDEIVKLIQYKFPSRLEKMYIILKENTEFLFHLQKSFLDYNMKRISIINSSKKLPSFDNNDIFQIASKEDSTYNTILMESKQECLSPIRVLSIEPSFDFSIRSNRKNSDSLEIKSVSSFSVLKRPKLILQKNEEELCNCKII